MLDSGAVKPVLAAVLVLLAVLSASAAAPVPERFDRPASERFAPREPPRYAAASGTGAAAVVLAVWPGVLQTASEREDVLLLRLGLLGSSNHDVSGLDLNLLYGCASGAERAVQLGAVNVVHGPLSGAQLGLLNLSGLLARGPGSAGVQLGLLGNYSDSLAGAQAGFFLNRARTGAGAQVAAVCNFSDRFRGVQLAAVNLEADEFRGVQLGVANAGAKDFAGIQLGLVNRGGGRFSGVQIAVANTVETLDGGFQLGLANFAREARGWQIGLYNDARSLRGVQIGFANVAGSSGFPVLPFLRISL